MTAPDLEQIAVLVADDDPVTRRLLRHHLQPGGYRLIEASDGTEAKKLLSEDVAVALFDLQMPGASGLECLAFVREHFPDTQVLMISGQGEIRDAVLAMKQGAGEYITKPWDPDEILARVQQAIKAFHLAREHRGLRQTVGGPLLQADFVAKSPASRALLSQVDRVARLDTNVLIRGPSGTGKTTLARMIHQRGVRAGGPFVAISCAALPRDLIEAELFGHEKGAFTGAFAARTGHAELAHGGTLFLDEIGDLPLELQPKLLTFLQDRIVQRIGGSKAQRVDVRVIAATHQDLQAMCQQKVFRQDLFFRLNVLSLEVPPLAGRSEDILELARQTLLRIARQRGSFPLDIAEDACQAMLAYSWPGNIRELENVLERASAFCQGRVVTRADLVFHDVVGTPHVATPGNPGSLAGLTLEEIERRAIRDSLDACGGNRAAAARMLGVSERTIYNKIRLLSIQTE